MNTNLDDDMDAPALLGFWKKYHRPTRADIVALFGSSGKGKVIAAKDLANYASNKATAIQCRERGDIRTAQMYEGICERIYSGLPDFARW